MERPSALFDREDEWAALKGFAARGRSGLAIVRGRRRHGKTALVAALADATGAFYHQAIRGVAADQRADLARAWAQAYQGPQPAFADWASAVDTLLSGHGDTPRPVIVDELPYWTDSSAEVPSLLQRGLDRAARDGGGVPLLVCGSAQAVMGRLLRGEAPLRGRAQLELDVRPFGYRDAARFCGLAPDVALPVHAVVGGVPGYAVELLDRTFPDGPDDVERWLVEVAASPARPLVHEARALLDTEPGVRDPALYLSVLGVMANGATRVGEISGLLGRTSDATAHALRTLAELGLVGREEDVLKRGRPTWHITDPLLRFYAALLRPRWATVERGDRQRLAAGIREPWRARILGPHLEALAREWAGAHASEKTLGGEAATIGRGTVDDLPARTAHGVDVVALDPAGSAIALGEAKLGPLGAADLHRLQRLRAILAEQGRGRPDARLLLVGASGFAPEATGPDVELVDLHRLYAGT